METLREITGTYVDVAFDDNLTTEQIAEKINALNEKIEIKCENGISVIQNLQAKATAMDAEIKRLTQCKKAIESRIASIKDYYIYELSSIGKKKVLTNLGTMTVAKVGGKKPLKIDDETAIPQEYFNQRTVYELDKEKLRTAIEDGEVVKGAHLEERGSYLKIS